MAEYISREALLKRLDMASDCKNCPRCVDMKTYYDRCAYTDIQDVCSVISDMPIADVQPVIHAYWIELPKALNPNENPCKCSNCGHVLSFMNYYPKSKYCDDCGARMDLKDGD
jgi:hypothetical protein